MTYHFEALAFTAWWLTIIKIVEIVLDLQGQLTGASIFGGDKYSCFSSNRQNRLYENVRQYYRGSTHNIVFIVQQLKQIEWNWSGVSRCRPMCSRNHLTASPDYIRFLVFYWHTKNQYINQEDLYFLPPFLSNLNDFLALEVANRVDETLLHVGENVS